MEVDMFPHRILPLLARIFLFPLLPLFFFFLSLHPSRLQSAIRDMPMPAADLGFFHEVFVTAFPVVGGASRRSSSMG
eukprot:scaffold240_cov243-Pinguiococcus_pyrenoidosus.AAC.24